MSNEERDAWATEARDAAIEKARNEPLQDMTAHIPEFSVVELEKAKRDATRAALERLKGVMEGKLDKCYKRAAESMSSGWASENHAAITHHHAAKQWKQAIAEVDEELAKL